jgi:hypothetical protein
MLYIILALLLVISIVVIIVITRNSVPELKGTWKQVPSSLSKPSDGTSFMTIENNGKAKIIYFNSQSPDGFAADGFVITKYNENEYHLTFKGDKNAPPAEYVFDGRKLLTRKGLDQVYKRESNDVLDISKLKSL